MHISNIINSIYNSLLNKYYGFNLKVDNNDLTLLMVNDIFDLQDDCIKEKLNTTFELNRIKPQSEWLFNN